MRILCMQCHKPVSTEIADPDDTIIIRAIVLCPECFANQHHSMKDYARAYKDMIDRKDKS